MSADFFEGDGRMDIVISHGADESPVHAEEQMLDWIFHVFDSEGRGKVSVLQIMERLKSIIDPSRDGDKLQCLCEMLDPEDQGTLIDLETFRRIMTEWIASCCQDGEFEGKTSSDDRSVKDFPQVSAEKLLRNDAQLVGYGGDDQKCLRENADLISKITELNFDNKNLTEEKGKLQRSLELSDEMNAHLTEEISTLKNKLKSFQQTVQHAQSVSSELEDIKTLVRDLEDKVGALCFEKKQLDKENMSLHKQVQALQEGNEKWLHDKEQAKEKVNELRSANSRIMCKLCEYERLLLEKEELLAQKMMQSKELQGIVEEHISVIQELKTQKNHLQEQLMQTREDKAILSVTSPHLAQSVCAEIAEIDTDQSEKSMLPSPLCGITQYSSIQGNKQDVDAAAVDAGIELLLVQLMQGTDVVINLLQQVVSPDRSSSQHLQEHSHILQQRLGSLCQLKNAWKQLLSMLNGALQLYTEKEQSLHPGPRFRIVEGCTVGKCWTQLRRKASLLKLLVLVFGTLFFYPINSNKSIFTVVSGLLAPHLCIQHLQPPPF